MTWDSDYVRSRREHLETLYSSLEDQLDKLLDTMNEVSEELDFLEALEEND